MIPQVLRTQMYRTMLIDVELNFIERRSSAWSLTKSREWNNILERKNYIVLKNICHSTVFCLLGYPRFILGPHWVILFLVILRSSLIIFSDLELENKRVFNGLYHVVPPQSPWLCMWICVSLGLTLFRGAGNYSYWHEITRRQCWWWHKGELWQITGDRMTHGASDELHRHRRWEWIAFRSAAALQIHIERERERERESR